MLIEFSVKNYRSFRDEAVLSMEANGSGTLKSVLIPFGGIQILPGVAIYGKNGGGKSNVIRAFWLAVQFIKNAQKTQHENAAIPVVPFALNDYSASEPTEFSFVYTLDDIKYWYSFAATKEKVYSESLYYAPKKQKALVFARDGQTFTFTTDKSRRNLISKVVADNQLFFSVACTMNDDVCAMAMFWFRQMVYFSRDYSDIPRQLLEYSNDSNMLKAISDYAKAADVGIEDMKFEINSKEINEEADLPANIPEEVKAALVQFMHVLSETSNNSETHLKMGQVNATSMHQGQNKDGTSHMFSMELADESDGTRKLMAIAPAIDSVLSKGGLLLVDEIEKELGIPTCPVNWPIGSGKQFAGVYDRKSQKIDLFEDTMKGTKMGTMKEIALDDPEISNYVTDEAREVLEEEIELLDGASAEFDQELVDA